MTALAPRLPCWLLAIGPLLLVSGCLPQILPNPTPARLTYDFGPLPDPRPAPLALPFRLESVTAPSWLSTPNILYRRLDEQPSALRPYARNEWIAPVPELFAARLAHRLAQAAPNVSREGLPLHLEIVALEHVYTHTSEAYVVARARASYEDFDGHVHYQEFEQRRPAAADVGGATEALPVVADHLVDEILEWLRRETFELGP